MTTIIIAHPNPESYHHAITKALSDTNTNIIDLYQDKFNPVMSLEDLNLFTSGTSTDPMVKTYQDAITASNHLIFVFPIWWFGAPAIMKGFFDKVLLPNFGYGIHEDGSFYGLLDHVTQIDVVTCAFATKNTLETVTKDPIQTVFMDVSLGRCFKNAQMQWHHLGDIANATQDQTSLFLKDITNSIKK